MNLSRHLIHKHHQERVRLGKQVECVVFGTVAGSGTPRAPGGIALPTRRQDLQGPGEKTVQSSDQDPSQMDQEPVPEATCRRLHLASQAQRAFSFLWAGCRLENPVASAPEN